MADEEEDLLVDDPVDPYEPETESALDEGAEEEPPAPLIDEDEDDAGVMDDVADGELADPPVEDDDAGEDLAPLPESWAELDPEAVDLPDADESEDTIADEVDALDDYDPLEITPDENEPEPEPVTWDSYEIQARDATEALSDFFQVALTDDPDAASVAVTTLEPGKTYDIRVRGVKADGSTSGWSATETVVLPVDQIPPPQPSAPVVVGVPGGFVVSHDGLTSAGDNQPADYAQTILWVRKEGGTPRIVDQFTGAFNITYNSLDTEPMVWWVTTVDKAGNASTKSAEVSGQPSPLVDDASIRSALDAAQAAIEAASDEARAELAVLDGRLTTAEGDLDAAEGRLDTAETSLATVFPRLDSAEAGVSDAAAAAQSAQAKADAAQALADQLEAEAASTLALAQAALRAGDNLIANGDMTSPAFWSLLRSTRHESGGPDGHPYMDFTGGTQTAYSTDAPVIRLDPGDSYAFEVWLKADKPGSHFYVELRDTDGTLSVRETSEVEPVPGRTYPNYLLSNVEVPTSWTRFMVTGVIRDTVGDAHRLVRWYFNHRNGSTTDAVVSVAGVALRRVPKGVRESLEAAQTAQAEASAAQAEAQAAHDLAQAAHSAAGAAQATADNALAMAGSKTTAYYSTSVPSGTGSDGDIWRQVDADRDVIGEWYWDGGWQRSQITTEQISNLDVGKLTVGTGVISELVAQHIAAQSAEFLEVDVEQLRVTGTGTMTEAVLQKLWADGLAAYTATLAQAVIASPNLIPGMGAIGERVPAPFEAFGHDPAEGSVSSTTATGAGVNLRTAAAHPIPLEAGQEYVFTLEDSGEPGSVYFVQLSHVGGTAATGTVVDGASTSYLLSGITVGAEWQAHRRRFTVPTTGEYRLLFYTHHQNGAQVVGAVQKWRGIAVRNTVDGTLIADNSITAPKITASQELTAKIAQFLTVKADQLDANEIWANSAWLGEAKFESEVSGNRVLINSDGVQIGSTTTPAGITLDRNGFLLKNGDGSSTFALNGNTGDVSMYGATITAGQLRTAETGRRVTVDNNGITAYDSAGVVQSRFGSNAYNNSLAIRSPDGTLKEIGPHIYGSHSFSSYGTGTEASFNKGTATAYGSYTGATWSQQFQTVSNRYRVDLSFLLYGFVESSGRTATFDFWLVPTDTAATVLGGNFYRRELALKNLVVEFPICYSTSLITTLPPSVAVGDTIRLRWQGRAKNFYTNPRMSYLSAHLTPA